jgi:hypothetical protein
MTLTRHPTDAKIGQTAPSRAWQANRDRDTLKQEETMRANTSTPRRSRSLQASPIDKTDYDTREGLAARRNVLFGLWAARRLGLDASEHDAFAWNVHFADLSEPGHDDVIEAVARAFRERGITITDRALRSQLREMTLRAVYDLSVQEGRR